MIDATVLRTAIQLLFISELFDSRGASGYNPNM